MDQLYARHLSVAVRTQAIFKNADGFAERDCERARALTLDLDVLASRFSPATLTRLFGANPPAGPWNPNLEFVTEPYLVRGARHLGNAAGCCACAPYRAPACRRPHGCSAGLAGPGVPHQPLPACLTCRSTSKAPATT